MHVCLLRRSVQWLGIGLILLATLPTATANILIEYQGDGDGKITGDFECDTTELNCVVINASGSYTVTAEPAATSTFGGWDCPTFTSTELTQTLIVSGDLFCDITFNARPNRTLTITPPSNGSVTSSPAGIDCGLTCSSEFFQNTEVTLTATPNPDYALFSWSGDSDCSDGVITLAESTTCNAIFAPTINLTTEVTIGSGRITSEPAGIDCGTVCSEVFPENLPVTLYAEPAPGFAFNAWEGDEDCRDGVVTMNLAKNCAATFLPALAVTVTKSGDGAGTVTSQPAGIDCGVTCTGGFISGGAVSFIATPEVGSSFLSWAGDADCSDGQLTVDTPKNCIANFGISGSPQFNETELSVTEEVGNATIRVNRVGGTQGEVRINYATADDTAQAGLDYTATAGSLVWASDDTEAKTINIPILLDGEAEADETLLVTLANDTGAVIQQLTLTITNVEVFSSLQFAIGSYIFNEADGEARLLVTRAVSSAGDISVEYGTTLTETDTATPFVDFTAVGGSLSWTTGDLQHKEISVPLLLDTTTENPETFSVTLANLMGGGELGALAQTRITLLDTPPAGSLQFSAPEFSGQEGSNAVITVNRIGGGLGNVGVNYATRNGSALVNEDYTQTQGVLNWADGDIAPKVFEVPLLTDPLEEGEEILSVILDNASGGASVGARFSAALKVLDAFGTPTTPVTPTPIPPPTPDPDPTPTPPVEPTPPPLQPGLLQFTASTYSVAENGLAAVLTVTRTGGSDGIVSVKYTTVDGTAQAGQDYVRQSRELLWFDGETTAKTINIGIYDNAVPENTETFSVQLSETSGGASLGIAETQVSISDNDATTVQLISANYTPLESDPVVRIRARRSGGDIGQVTVTYETVAGTASAGIDYQDTAGALTWISNDTEDKFIVIRLLNDRLDEGSETFSVRLLEVLTENADLAEPLSTEVTIRDNDGGAYTPTTRQDGGVIVDGPVSDLTEPLENVVLVTENGSVTRSQLGGYFVETFVVENQGSLADVTLLTGTIVNGGLISERLTSLDPTKPASLINVNIAPDTELSHILIAGDSQVNTTRLGAGVLFEHNGLIPSDADLSLIMGRFETTIFGQNAVILTHDVLRKSSTNGVLTGINGLPELIETASQFIQREDNGQLEFDRDGKQYHLLPLAVTQILANQVLNEIPLDMLEQADGSFTFVTHTGREIIAQPVLQAPDAFLSGLAEFGLDQVTMNHNGNFRVAVGDSDVYYMGRADNFSRLLTSATLPEGVNGEGTVFLVYRDSTGILRQQFIYPAAAFAEELLAFSSTSDSQTLLYLDGRAEIHQGRGDAKLSYKGIFEYVVTGGIPPLDGTTQLLAVDDANGDGLSDYQIVYTNGDRQFLYRLP